MTIEQRLEKLERQVVVWRRVAIGFPLILVFILSCVSSGGLLIRPLAQVAIAEDDLRERTEARIRTETVEIVNRKGQVVGELTGMDRGATLVLRDAEGADSIILSTSIGMPYCEIVDNDDVARMTGSTVEVYPTDAVSMKQRRQLEQKVASGKGLSARDLESMKGGGAQFPAVQIGRSTQGGGVIDVYNPFGKIVTSLQCTKVNSGAVIVNDVNGNVVNALLADR